MIHLYTWCKSINNNNNNKLSIWKKTKYLTICNTWSKNNLALFCCYSSYTELPPSPFPQLQNSWKPVVSGSSRFPLVLSRETEISKSSRDESELCYQGLCFPKRKTYMVKNSAACFCTQGTPHYMWKGPRHVFCSRLTLGPHPRLFKDLKTNRKHLTSVKISMRSSWM